MIRIGSLFTGVGGLDLGIERALAPSVVLWQVELDAWRRSVLERHWPRAQRFDDVRAVGGFNLEPVDVIIGGFPCQNISAAGRGEGLVKGEKSGLWREYARIVRQVAPALVIIENSPLLRTRGLNVVLDDLSACGYDAEWDCVPAGAVGAPHRRDRIFVIAWKSVRRPWEARSPNPDRILRLVEQRLAGRRARGVRDGEEAEPVDGGASGAPSDADRERRQRQEQRAAESGRGARAERELDGALRGVAVAVPDDVREFAYDSPDADELGRNEGASDVPQGRDGANTRRLRGGGDAPDADGEPLDVAGRALLLPDAARDGASRRVADADAERRIVGTWGSPWRRTEPAHSRSGGDAADAARARLEDGDGLRPRDRAPGAAEAPEAGREPRGARDDGRFADADDARQQRDGPEPDRAGRLAPLADAERSRASGRTARAGWLRRVLIDLGRAALGLPRSAVARVRRVDDGLPEGSHRSADDGPREGSARVGDLGERGAPDAQSAAPDAQPEAREAPVDGAPAPLADGEPWPAPRGAWQPQEAWPVRVLDAGERRPREDHKRIAAIGDAVVVAVAEHIGTVALLVLERELSQRSPPRRRVYAVCETTLEAPLDAPKCMYGTRGCSARHDEPRRS